MLDVLAATGRGPLPADLVGRARATVARWSRTPEECRELLSMLGIADVDDEG